MQEIYLKIRNDKRIMDIYELIGKQEVENKMRAYHNLNHIENVSNILESILRGLNFDEEYIYKAKIACLLHDVGVTEGKENHAFRSYEFAKKYFKENNIYFDGIEQVCEAIKLHSNGFDTDNTIALALILADKLDVKKSRITDEGKKVEGNRQYSHIEDIKITIENNTLMINFLTDNNLDIEEMMNYYFTKKIFNSIKAFANKLNLGYLVLIDNNKMEI